MIGENWNRKKIWKTIIGWQEMSHPSKKKLQETHEFSYYYVSSKLQVPVFSEIRSGNYIPQNWSCWVTLTFKHPERWTIWWIYAPKQEADWHMIDKRISPAAANCERTGKACESWNFIIWVGKKCGSLLKHKRGLWCKTIRWLKIWKILAPLGFFSAASSMSPWSVIRRSLSPGFVDDDWRGFPACS